MRQFILAFLLISGGLLLGASALQLLRADSVTIEVAQHSEEAKLVAIPQRQMLFRNWVEAMYRAGQQSEHDYKKYLAEEAGKVIRWEAVLVGVVSYGDGRGAYVLGVPKSFANQKDAVPATHLAIAVAGPKTFRADIPVGSLVRVDGKMSTINKEWPIVGQAVIELSPRS